MVNKVFINRQLDIHNNLEHEAKIKFYEYKQYVVIENMANDCLLYLDVSSAKELIKDLKDMLKNAKESDDKQ